VFFANVAGVPTRRVSVGGVFEGISLSGHDFAESFIKEKGQWAYVDIISNRLLFVNKNGDYLNTLDLFFMNLKKIYPEGVTVSLGEKGRFSKISYSSPVGHQCAAYYFRRDATFEYPVKRERFFLSKEFTDKYYYLFSPDFAYSLRASNAMLYWKLIFFYGEIIFIGAWSVLAAIFMIKFFKKS